VELAALVDNFQIGLQLPIQEIKVIMLAVAAVLVHRVPVLLLLEDSAAADMVQNKQVVQDKLILVEAVEVLSDLIFPILG
jgi:hypothetical protein